MRRTGRYKIALVVLSLFYLATPALCLTWSQDWPGSSVRFYLDIMWFGAFWISIRQ